jgi:hypothetical protein
MANGVIDIREAVPEVKEMVKARAEARMTLPPGSTISAVERVVPI